MPPDKRSPPEVPRLRAGILVTTEDLAPLARQAVEKDGRTINEIAAERGQKGPAVSRAINQPQASATTLRCELIELAGYKVEGPFYRIVKA